MLPLLEKYKLNLKVKLIDDASFLDIAPWMLSAPTVWFDLTNLKKDTTNHAKIATYKQFYLQLITNYPS